MEKVMNRCRYGAVALALSALAFALALATPAAALVDDVGQEAGALSVQDASGSGSVRPMFREYNSYSGEHFYTADVPERAGLVMAGWDFEGAGWYAPTSGEPVYRLYNPYVGDHHYTLDAAERDMLVAAGWTDEGVGWLSAGSDGVPLYREYNPNEPACNHNYTTDKAEHDNLVSLGWRDEGIAWYGLPGSAVEAAKGASLSMDDPLDVHDVNELVSAFTGHWFLSEGGTFSRDDIRKDDLEMMAHWVYLCDYDSFKWGEDGVTISRARASVSACDAVTRRYLGVSVDWTLDPLAGDKDFSGYRNGYVYTNSSTAKQWGSASTATAITDTGGGRYRVAFETTTWNNIYANYMVNGFLDMIEGRNGKEALAYWLTRDEFERYAGTLGRKGEAVVEVTLEDGMRTMRLVSMTIDPAVDSSDFSG